MKHKNSDLPKKKSPTRLPPKEQRDWRTEKEAAEYIGVSLGKLRQMRRSGKGPRWYYAAGTSVIRYNVTDLDDWIDRNKCGVAV
jgi:hypothetical protein